MPTRRNVLKGGVGLSMMPLLNIPVADAKSDTAATIQNIWVDTGLEAGQSFALRAEQLGANVIDANAGESRQMFSQLDLEWRTNPVALAGITSHGPMFTLEMLGRRHGMRLAYSAKMIRWNNGSAGVEVTGISDLASSTPAPGNSDSSWAIEMANFTLSVPLEKLISGGESASRQIGEKMAGSYDEPLYIWVITPVSGAARYIAPTTYS